MLHKNMKLYLAIGSFIGVFFSLIFGLFTLLTFVFMGLWYQQNRIKILFELFYLISTIIFFIKSVEWNSKKINILKITYLGVLIFTYILYLIEKPFNEYHSYNIIIPTAYFNIDSSFHMSANVHLMVIFMLLFCFTVLIVNSWKIHKNYVK